MDIGRVGKDSEGENKVMRRAVGIREQTKFPMEVSKSEACTMYNQGQLPGSGM